MIILTLPVGHDGLSATIAYAQVEGVKVRIERSIGEPHVETDVSAATPYERAVWDGCLACGDREITDRMARGIPPPILYVVDRRDGTPVIVRATIASEAIDRVRGGSWAIPKWILDESEERRRQDETM